jgi:hypothetical protein
LCEQLVDCLVNVVNKLTSTIGGYSSDSTVLAVKILVHSFGDFFGFLRLEWYSDEILGHSAFDDQYVTGLVGRLRQAND